MINNDLSNQLGRFFNNRPGKADAAQSTATELYKKLKAKQGAIQGNTAPTAEDAAKTDENAAAAKPQNAAEAARMRKKAKTQEKQGNQDTQDKDTATTSKGKADENLSPMERRQKELQAIMDKLNAEEAIRYPNRYKKEADKTDPAKQDGVTTTDDVEQFKDRAGALGFLNDMPLFNEFKTSLMDAFKQLDGATAGSISAQYELNYTSMQYIANAAGDYEYKETSFNVKLDLNYIKAASGGQTGKDLADAIGSSTDFASLVENLQKAGQAQGTDQAAQSKFDPQTFMNSMKDYFSPEKTAGRIVDFASAFFPLSSAFKAKGDTEEARTEFAELMRGAIQKGFDQAQGILGKVPKPTQDGIDKTHELTMKGLDDFIKNGLNKQKQDEGVYNSLEQFAFKFEMSYSEKTVSVRNYNANGTTTTKQSQQAQPALDTQA